MTKSVVALGMTEDVAAFMGRRRRRIYFDGQMQPV
jgi:hypothetical protein